MNALKQRAQAVLNDESLDDQSRATLRYAMEQNDLWLADLVRYAESDEDDSSRRKIEALAEIICGAGDQSAAALFVLMGTMQISNEPAALANTVKHLPSRAAVSSTSSEWLTLKLQLLKVSCWLVNRKTSRG